MISEEDLPALQAYFKAFDEIELTCSEALDKAWEIRYRDEPDWKGPFAKSGQERVDAVKQADETYARAVPEALLVQAKSLFRALKVLNETISLEED